MEGGVCTFDRIYWANEAAERGQGLSYATLWSVMVTFLLIIFGTQGFQLRSRGVFLLSASLLGLTLLLYFSAQLGMETRASYRRENIHYSIYPEPEFKPFTAGGGSLKSPVMWYEAAITALSSLGIGTGFNQYIGISAPYGLQAVKLAGIVCFCHVLVLTAFSAIGFHILRSVAATTYVDLAELMRPMYDLIAIILPASIGEVAHKRFIGSILLIAILMSALASHVVYFYGIVRAILSTKLMRSLRHNDVIVYVMVTAYTFLLFAVAHWRKAIFSFDSNLIWEYTALLECILWGWFRYSDYQCRQIGAFATYGWMFLFNVFGSTLLIAFVPMIGSVSVTPGRSALPAYVYQVLPIVVGCGSYALSLAFMVRLLLSAAKKHYDRQASRCGGFTDRFSLHTPMHVGASSPLAPSISPSGTPTGSNPSPAEMTQRHSHVWWLLIGNVEVLRHTLNRITTPGIDLRTLLRLNLEVVWSFAIKYYIPFFLTLLIYHRSEDLDSSLSGNLLGAPSAGSAGRQTIVGPYLKLHYVVALPLVALLCLVFITSLTIGRFPRLLASMVPENAGYRALRARTGLVFQSPRLWSTIKNKYFLEFHNFYADEELRQPGERRLRRGSPVSLREKVALLSAGGSPGVEKIAQLLQSGSVVSARGGGAGAMVQLASENVLDATTGSCVLEKSYNSTEEADASEIRAQAERYADTILDRLDRNNAPLY